MAPIKINKRVEFYSLDIEGDTASIYDFKGVLIDQHTFDTAPQYGGLYVAFNENTVFGLTGAQSLTRGAVVPTNDTQNSSLPGFSSSITVEGFSGPRNVSSGGEASNNDLFEYSEIWNDTYIIPGPNGEPTSTTDQYRDTVTVSTVEPSVSSIRNTTSETRIPILTNLLASDYRSFVSYRDSFLYTTDFSTSGITQRFGGLLSGSSSRDISADRVLRYVNVSGSSQTGGFSENQVLLFDARRANDFAPLTRYVYEFDVGVFNAATDILTLDNPVVDRDIYYFSSSTEYQQQTRTDYEIEFDDGVPGITVAQLIGQLQALPVSTTVTYTRVEIDNGVPIGTPSPISAGQFQFSNETMYVQDGLLNFGRITGVTSTTVANTDNSFRYDLIPERIPTGKDGYLCRSKGNGLFDIYSCFCSLLDGEPTPQMFVSQSSSFTPPKLSYSTLTLGNLNLVHEDLKFWPHGVEGKDTFAVRNWEAMGCKKKDSVLYSDEERATRIFGQGNPNIE